MLLGGGKLQAGLTLEDVQAVPIFRGFSVTTSLLTFTHNPFYANIFFKISRFNLCFPVAYAGAWSWPRADVQQGVGNRLYDCAIYLPIEWRSDTWGDGRYHGIE